MLGTFTEFSGAALVRDLHGAERRQIPVDEHRLHIAPVDRRVGLKEHSHEQIGREELVRADDVNPGTLVPGIGVQIESLQLILG